MRARRNTNFPDLFFPPGFFFIRRRILALISSAFARTAGNGVTAKEFLCFFLTEEVAKVPPNSQVRGKEAHFIPVAFSLLLFAQFPVSLFQLPFPTFDVCM